MRELILYISEKSVDDNAFGYTKLNKLLFLIDFSAYIYLGSSVTGHEYQKKQYGPVPVGIGTIRKRLVKDEQIRIKRIGYLNSGARQYIPQVLRPAKHDVFESGELNLIDGIIKRWKSFTAKEISEKSHEFTGWKIVQHDEPIPYGFGLIDKRKPRAAEVAYARTLAAIPEQERRRL